VVEGEGWVGLGMISSVGLGLRRVGEVRVGREEGGLIVDVDIVVLWWG